MVERTEINYPDVLGYITGGERANISALQAALALRPRVVRAGHPVEVVLLLQNASDIGLEVTATLRLPDRDLEKKRDRFLAKAERLVIGLEPAQVGCAVLPFTTLPDTAVGTDYKIGMEVRVKPLQKNKPTRLRLEAGGGEFDPSSIREEARAIITGVNRLHWHTETGRLRNSVLEADLTIISGKVGKLPGLDPSWSPLWSMEDHVDHRLLFERYQKLIERQVLPQLKADRIYPIVLEQTIKKLQNDYYPLHNVEVKLIARLLTLILELGRITQRDRRFMDGSRYSIKRYLSNGYLDDPTNRVNLPHWCNALLLLIQHDRRAAELPVYAIAHLAYDSLLRDALEHAFDRMEVATGEEMGSRAERTEHIDQTLQRIEEGTLDFDSLYLPLMLGAIAAADQVTLKEEQGADLIPMVENLVKARCTERSEQNQEVFDMLEQFLQTMIAKYRSNQW